MIEFPFESTVINRKNVTESPNIGFHKGKNESDPWYETKILFDLKDVVAFDQTFFKDIEPLTEAVEIESCYRYTFTIKCTYKKFKSAMKRAGMIK